jgi:hypothetical protein
MRALAVAALVAVIAVPVSLASSHGRFGTTLTVTHGPVKLVYTDAAPAGPSVGDSYSANVRAKGPGGEAARVVGALTTVAEDTPAKGKEIRTTNLVFIFSNPNDQLQIGGASVYAKTAPTRPKASTTVRPILGGSGKYAGATGWCVTVHYVDGHWTHTFHFTG